MDPALALPSSPVPDVVVVVLATRRGDRLRACLEAIAADDSNVAAQAVVCCNAADPSVMDVVAASSGAVVMRSQVNLGTAVTWNRAAEAIKAPRIAIVHEDARPAPGWLDALTSALDADPDTVIAGATTVGVDGRVNAQGFVLWSDGTSWPVSGQLAAGLELPEQPYPVDIVNSATMLVERTHWEESGGFHEGTFPLGFVEQEVCTSARARGHRVVVVPATRSVHETGAMYDEHGGPLASKAFGRFLYERNLPRFRARWAAVLERQLDPPRSTSGSSGALAAGLARAAAPEAVLDTSPPSAERSITAGAPAANDAPAEVEQRATECLDVCRNDFLAWLTRESDELAALRGTTVWRAHEALVARPRLRRVAGSALHGVLRVSRAPRAAWSRRVGPT